MRNVPAVQLKTAFTRSRHFATLDGLRGVAALLVVLLHSTQLFNHPLRWHVEVAVDFFFVLSGFVIGKAYEKKLQTSMTRVEFVRVRLVRLYPMIFIGVMFGICVIILRTLIHGSYTWKQILIVSVSGLLLLPTNVLGRGDIYPADSPSWSLFFELFINLVYVSVARWLNNKRLVAVCVISGAALCIVARQHQGVNVGFLPENFWLGFIRITFPFSLGILLSRCRPARQIGSATTYVLMLVLVAVLCAPLYVGSWIYDCVAVGLIFPAIIFFGTGCKNNPALDKTCIRLGELSYPLYISHYPLLRVISNALEILHWRLAPGIAIPLATLVTIPAAVLFLKVWDQPVRAWLNARFEKSRVGIIPATVLGISHKTPYQSPPEVTEMGL